MLSETLMRRIIIRIFFALAVKWVIISCELTGNKLLGEIVSLNEQLKQAGLKVTTPRLKVLQVLQQSGNHHVSAEDVYKMLLEQGDDVGLATVYRILIQFESVGLVLRHNFEGGHFVYELSQGEHHDHLVCLRCGFVEEFLDEVIELRQKAIAEKAHFMMTAHSLNIYGTCARCI